jgi:hypothetical protein
METVLVLGAGASKPYGFPLGSELLRNVITMLPKHNGRHIQSQQGLAVSDALLHLIDSRQIEVAKCDVLPLLAGFRQLLEKQEPRSIDEFLSRDFGSLTQAYRWIGKLAIAYLIGSAESWENIDSPPREKESHADDWFRQLWQSLNIGSVQQFKAVPLKVVSFNYDRSFDAYLAEKLTFVEAKSPRGLRQRDESWWSDGAHTLDSIDLIHVYGSLGSLSEFDFGNKYIGMNSTINLVAAAKRIRVIGEERAPQDTDLFSKAKDWIQAAERVVFLGFGFDPTNMSRLGLDGGVPQFKSTSSGNTATHVYATTFGLEWAERELVCQNYFFHALRTTANNKGPFIQDSHIDIVHDSVSAALWSAVLFAT